jgi:hypothetical protein
MTDSPRPDNPDPTRTPTPQPLTDQAIARLRRLANGNGIMPEAITLVETVEKIYTLTGILTLTPRVDKQSSRYPGGVHGNDRIGFDSFAALQEDASQREKTFKEQPDWIAQSRRELEAAPGLGWGLHDANITFPEKTVVLAASETCPACRGQKQVTCAQCQGQGTLLCPQCRGQRQEMCYGCGGRGENPAQPGQVCAVCNGSRLAPCRTCRGVGHLVCPTCGGRRGTPCTGCNGTGLVTQEIALSFNAATQFRLTADTIPSGLRRGLDRLGVANLAKGYADIVIIDKPVEDEVQSAHSEAEMWQTIPPDMTGNPPHGNDAKTNKTDKPEVQYEATMPYADIRIRIGGGRVVQVSAFGKRGALLGVPPFLDAALDMARTQLKQAAQGADTLEAALKARAMRDALGLVLTGKGSIKELRRFYAVGLSPAAMQEILQNLQKALGRMTRRVRLIAATAATLLAGGLFGAVFLTGFHSAGLRGATPTVEAVADTSLLGVTMLGGWALLNAATNFVLRRRFSGRTVAVTQANGRIGVGMLAAILTVFIAVMLVAPVRPNWLGLLFRQ